MRELIQAALETSVTPASHKLVLVGLAAHAGRDTRTAWPSVRTLAGYTGTHRATVHRALQALQATGHITAVGTRSRDVVEYRVNLAPAGADPALPPVTPVQHVGDVDVSHGRDMSHDATVAPVRPQVSHQRDKGVAPVQPTCRTDATQTPQNTTKNTTGNAAAARAAAREGGRAQARTREAAAPTPPTSAEDVDALLAWVAGVADHYGGRLAEALATDARQRQAALHDLLAGETPAVRMQLVAYVHEQAPTWHARSIALALGKPGVLQRARRDAQQATTTKPAAPVAVYRDRVDGDHEIARTLLDLPLDSGLLDLWIAPLSVAEITDDQVVLAGPAHVVSWCQRIAPDLAAAVGRTVRLEHADVSALPSVGDIHPTHASEAAT